MERIAQSVAHSDGDAEANGSNRLVQRVDTVQPLLVGRKEAARMLGLGLRTFDRMNSAAEIGPRPVRLGGRLLWRIDELREWATSEHKGRLLTREEWDRLKSGQLVR